ncbi:MAG TPA: hypothetical protein VJZ70_01890 [Limnochordia bacterium]|nr:hypothetical protein [Limnochordia bacterium]
MEGPLFFQMRLDMAAVREGYVYNRHDPLIEPGYGLLEEIEVPFDHWIAPPVNIMSKIMQNIKLSEQ